MPFDANGYKRLETLEHGQADVDKRLALTAQDLDRHMKQDAENFDRINQRLDILGEKVDTVAEKVAWLDSWKVIVGSVIMFLMTVAGLLMQFAVYLRASQ